MRLWHQKLIHYLPNRQLLGQHRECCALRGKGWGKKHSVVDYVFTYDRAHLYSYHRLIMNEMIMRGYSVSSEWYGRLYRGKQSPSDSITECGIYVGAKNQLIYSEHNDKYLVECLMNLKTKGAKLVNGETIEHMLIQLTIKGINGL